MCSIRICYHSFVLNLTNRKYWASGATKVNSRRNTSAFPPLNPEAVMADTAVGVNL
jgi:hypothetical protein